MPGHHPSYHARSKPDHPALVIADTGEVLTYRELDAQSNRFAQLLRARGLKPGDRIGVMMRNSLLMPVVYWGATRCGVFVTMLSTHLKPEEAAYILGDSASKLLVLSASVGATPRALAGEAGGRSRALSTSSLQMTTIRSRGQPRSARRWRPCLPSRWRTRFQASTCSIPAAPPVGPRVSPCRSLPAR
ncbi:AMP-binding protein [Novosphingobium sp. MW5]|nr:AMP-binding protein [Novosphingobium sp. MW5]